MTSSSAMAADNSSIDPDQAKLLSSIFGWMAGIATATIGAVAMWVTNRGIGRAAMDQAWNARFQTLMERTEAFHATERAAWQAERLQLRGEIVNLKQTVASLTESLRRHGISGLPEVERPDPIITLGPGDDPS